MKCLKLTSIATLLAIGVFFFASPVMAATPAFSSHKETALLSNNVNAELYVYQLSAEPVGTTYQSNFFVTMKVSNLIDTPVLVNNLAFNLVFTDASYPQTIVSVDNYSTDLVLSMGNTTLSTFSVAPSEDFAYGNGVVVPPNSSLYLVCNVCIKFNSASFGLSSVTIPQFSSARGNYSYGTAVDFSPLISSLNTYFSQEHLDNNNILTLLGTLKVDTSALVSDMQDLVDQVADLIDAVSYTGPSPSISYQPNSYRNSIYNSSNFYVSVSRFVGRSVPVVYDFETNASSDSLLSAGYLRIPVVVNMQIICANGSVRGPYELTINDIFPNDFRPELVYTDSSVVSVWSYDNRLTVRAVNMLTYSAGLYPAGRNSSIFIFYVYVPIGTTPTFGNFDISSLNPSVSLYDGYVPRNELDAWRHFLDAYSSTDRSDLDQQSDDIGSTSDAIHTQEEQFFNQNSQAIAQTGLSNYRFSSDQTGGISAVSNDFTAVFNALGGFNSVFIFSLTLALALRIIRHGPIVRSRKVNDVDPGGD